MDPLAVHRSREPLPLDAAAARRWLGGKGASVAELTAMGVPVPPGFTLTTDLWRAFERDGRLPDGLRGQLELELALLEQATGSRFGDPVAPLLVAVRSGGPTSMPGMLDTVLDVGVDGSIARGLAVRYEAPHRFGLDVRRRFVEGYATVVLGLPHDAFSALAGRAGAHSLDERGLAQLLVEYERLIAHEAGATIPDDPWEQLLASVAGVLASWRTPRAQKYRAAHGIPDDEGTGVTIQAMVYGNLGPRSGAGVFFTRNPSSGERAIFGEWLREAQGEDVVSGRRTPAPLARAQVRRGQTDESLETAMPEVFAELLPLAARLEERYGDVQDVEIAIERGQLFVLQCRPAKRSARAAARVAVEMVEEGRIDVEEALGRIEPSSLRQLLTPRLPDPQALAARGLTPLARGLAASAGAASGRIVLDAKAAEAAGAGAELILVRAETSAEDVETMRAVAGILTAAGGLTSHAAVVARAMGKPCVAGVSSLFVDYARRVVLARGEASLELAEGDAVTIDGGRGLVYLGEVPVEPAPASPHVETLLAWADARRTIEVLAEARSPRLARIGASFGADGVFVPRGREGSMRELREAAGEARLLVEVEPAEAREVAQALRPGTDRLLAAPSAIEAVRAAAPGFELWSAGPSAIADVALVELDSADPRPSGCWALRGELAVTVEGARLAPVAVVVAPLDVPVARLCAARR